jgi:hypothetical protein
LGRTRFIFQTIELKESSMEPIQKENSTGTDPALDENFPIQEQNTFQVSSVPEKTASAVLFGIITDPETSFISPIFIP